MVAEWMMTALFMVRLFAAELLYMWTNAGRARAGARGAAVGGDGNCGPVRAGTAAAAKIRSGRAGAAAGRRIDAWWAARLAAGMVLCTAVTCVLLPRISQDAAGTIAGFILVFLGTVLTAYAAYDVSFWTILFEAVAGYLTEHFASQVGILISYAFEAAGISIILPSILPDLLACAFVYPLFYVLFARQIRRGAHPNINNRRLISLAGMGLFVCIVLSIYPSARQMTLLEEAGIATGINTVFHLYAMFGSLTTLMLLFGLRTQGELQDRLLLSDRLLHQQQEQYRISRDNIELINIKCHDLKHQIAALREHPDEKSIREIEDAVRIYDSTIQTGNNALDVILTEKSLYCGRNGIRFTCIADGEKLDFMDPGDIYSFFGNIVSNAIEALERMEEESGREFSLSIREVGSYVVVLEQNPFEGEVHFTKGLPDTTKGDRRDHGFGMLSIRSIAEKYGGQLIVRAQDGVFTVKAVFPAGGGSAAGEG